MGIRLRAWTRTALLVCGVAGLTGGCGGSDVSPSPMQRPTEPTTAIQQQRVVQQQRYLQRRAQLLDGELKSVGDQERQQRLRELKRDMVDQGAPK